MAEQGAAFGRKTLQVYVTRLRHGVGASAIVERSAGYLLDPDLVSVDATRAATMVATAREVLHGGDAETAVGLLAQATTLFRGEPYEGVPDEALPAGEIARLPNCGRHWWKRRPRPSWPVAAGTNASASWKRSCNPTPTGNGHGDC